MTTYAFPNIKPSVSTWGIITNTKSFSSPLTGSTQTAVRKGTRWKCSFRFDNLIQSDSAIMQAFLAKLNGQEHRFTIKDDSYVMGGSGGGTPLVNGANQSGTSLVTDGWPNNITGVLKAGDRIEVGGELKMVTADVNSGATTGPATIPIIPEIHTSPANNDPITTIDPLVKLMLVQDSIEWTNNVHGYVTYQFSAIEDIL